MILELLQTTEGLLLTFNDKEFLIPDAYSSDMEIEFDNGDISGVHIMQYKEYLH